MKPEPIWKHTGRIFEAPRSRPKSTANATVQLTIRASRSRMTGDTPRAEAVRRSRRVPRERKSPSASDGTEIKHIQSPEHSPVVLPAVVGIRLTPHPLGRISLFATDNAHQLTGGDIHQDIRSKSCRRTAKTHPISRHVHVIHAPFSVLLSSTLLHVTDDMTQDRYYPSAAGSRGSMSLSTRPPKVTVHNGGGQMPKDEPSRWAGSLFPTNSAQRPTGGANSPAAGQPLQAQVNQGMQQRSHADSITQLMWHPCLRVPVVKYWPEDSLIALAGRSVVTTEVLVVDICPHAGSDDHAQQSERRWF